MSSIYGESRYLPISILISTQCVDIGNHQLKSNLCSITPSLLILIKVRTRPRDKEGKGFIGMYGEFMKKVHILYATKHKESKVKSSHTTSHHALG